MVWRVGDMICRAGGAPQNSGWKLSGPGDISNEERLHVPYATVEKDHTVDDCILGWCRDRYAIFPASENTV